MNNLFDGIWRFLTFESYLSPYVLMALYWLGTLGMPFLAWRLAAVVRRQFYLSGTYEKKQDEPRASMTSIRKMKGWLFMVSTFLFLVLELLWRMIFEFLITYPQMHDALLHLAE